MTLQVLPWLMKTWLAHVWVVRSMPDSAILTHCRVVLSAVVQEPLHAATYVKIGPQACGQVLGPQWNVMTSPAGMVAEMAPGAEFLWQLISDVW